MKKKFLLPLYVALPAILGIVLALYRNSLFNRYFNAESNALLAGSGSHFTLFFAASAAGAALCFVLPFFLRGIKLHHAVRQADTGLKTTRVLGGFALIAAGVLTVISAGHIAVLTLLKALFMVACGGAVIVYIKADSAQSRGLCALFPMFFMCIYLLSFYRDCARNPLVYTFAFETLTAIALMLALYLCTSPWFGKEYPGLQLFFAMLATLGSCTLLLGALLHPAVLARYLPIGLSDAVMLLGLLLVIWSDIFEATQPLPRESLDKPDFMSE